MRWRGHQRRILWRRGGVLEGRADPCDTTVSMWSGDAGVLGVDCQTGSSVLRMITLWMRSRWQHTRSSRMQRAACTEQHTHPLPRLPSSQHGLLPDHRPPALPCPPLTCGRSCTDQQFDFMVAGFQTMTVEYGDEVIKQGEAGDHFYIVYTGKFQVRLRVGGAPRTPRSLKPTGVGSRPQARTSPPPSPRPPPTCAYQASLSQLNNKVVATYGPGMSFGELALLYNSPRAATVACAAGASAEDTKAEIYALERKRFRHVMVHTGAADLTKKAETFLKAVKVLSTLTDAQRATLAENMEEFYFEDGEYVVNMGKQRIDDFSPEPDGPSRCPPRPRLLTTFSSASHLTFDVDVDPAVTVALPFSRRHRRCALLHQERRGGVPYGRQVEGRHAPHGNW